MFDFLHCKLCGQQLAITSYLCSECAIVRRLMLIYTRNDIINILKENLMIQEIYDDDDSQYDKNEDNASYANVVKKGT